MYGTSPAEFALKILINKLSSKSKSIC